MKKHKEIVTITTNNIDIIIEINYDEMTMSLVEKDCKNYKDKRWLFAGRGYEYTGGWLEILEAMKVAIEYGDKCLKEYDENKTKDFTDKIIKFSVE